MQFDESIRARQRPGERSKPRLPCRSGPRRGTFRAYGQPGPSGIDVKKGYHMKLGLKRTLIASAAVCVATGLTMVNSATADAATVPATSTYTMAVHLNGPSSNGMHPDASAGGQLSICFINITGTAASNDPSYVVVSVGATCQFPSFIVNGDIVYANNTHPYATTSTIGKSNGAGAYVSSKVQKGGTPGYRSAQWCVNIAEGNGATGSGCVAIFGM
jgi:hypothetical protein